MPNAVVDTSPLSATPTATQVRAYRSGRSDLAGPRVRVRPCLGGVSYTGLLLASGAVCVALATARADPRAVLLSGLVAAGAAAGALLCARATRRRTFVREYRLAAFAARNGLTYERGAAVPSVGAERYCDDGGRPLRRFTGIVEGVAVEAGNYRHSTGDITGYLVANDRVEIVPPFDFVLPGEWQRAWSLMSA